MSSNGRSVDAEPQKISRKVSLEVQARRSNVFQVRSLRAVREESWAAFTQAQTPALDGMFDQLKLAISLVSEHAYSRPKLSREQIPIFLVVLILTFHMIVTGRIARTKSIAAFQPKDIGDDASTIQH